MLNPTTILSMDTNAETLRPAGRDPLTKQLVEKGWWRVILVVAIVLVFSGLPFITSALSGRLVNDSLTVDLSGDIGYMVMYLFLVPFFILFTPFYLKSLGSVIDELRKNGILIIRETEYIDSVRYANRLFDSALVTFLPYILALLLGGANLYNFIAAAGNSWFYLSLNDGRVIATIVVIPTVLFYLFFFILAVRITITFRVINRMLEGNLDVQPLHPDNCGGLSPLGDFALKISWAGIGIGLPLMILVYANYVNDIPYYHVYNTLNIATYLLAMIAVFFMPLIGARKSMIKSKQKELQIINQRFQVERRRILARINSNDFENLRTANLEELMKLYDVAKNMPVYPFNSKNIFRFLGGTLWPILLLLLQYAIEKF
jgi:hypothetical protein